MDHGGVFSLWRKDGFAGQVRIPDSVDSGDRSLLTDRDGSPFAWTKRGLLELVPDGKDLYKPGRLWRAPELKGIPFELLYSQLGLLIVNIQGNEGLVLIRWPDERN